MRASQLFATTILQRWVWCSRRGQSYRLCNQSTAFLYWSPEVESPSTTYLEEPSLTACIRKINFSDKDRPVQSCTETVNCYQKEHKLRMLPSNTGTESLSSLTPLGPEDKEGTPSCLWSKRLIFKRASNRIWLSWACHSDSVVSSLSAERSSCSKFASFDLRWPSCSWWWVSKHISTSPSEDMDSIVQRIAQVLCWGGWVDETVTALG